MSLTEALNLKPVVEGLLRCRESGSPSGNMVLSKDLSHANMA